MTTYYIKDNEKIVLWDEDLKKLQDTLLFTPQYQNLEIQQTQDLIVDGVIITQAEYEIYLAQKKRDELNMLSLTAADVERAIYKAKGMDFEDIIALVEKNQPQNIDIKALKIELKANNFYRGNQYINTVGALLGFTSEMLDEFFETNDYTKLI